MQSQLQDETDRAAPPAARPEDAGVHVSIFAMVIGWALGLAGLAALIGFTLHFGDIEAFLAAVRSADAGWLAIAVLCQAGTYVCVAATWSRTLANSGVRYRFSSLLRLSVIELFVNQALPTGGLSGSLVVVRGLSSRGVSSSVATAALLIAAASYYVAYLIVAAIAFGLLWLHGDFNDGWMLTSVVFLLMLAILAWLVVSAARSGRSLVPKFARQWPGLKHVDALWAQVRVEFIRNRRVLGETVLLQALVFLLDAVTLYCTAHAVGSAVHISAAFSSFMLASVVATLAPIPLGLGTFEATSTAMLHLLGASTESALAATLILRGLTFWLPMLPGLWLLFRENRRHRRSASVAERSGS